MNKIHPIIFGVIIFVLGTFGLMYGEDLSLRVKWGLIMIQFILTFLLVSIIITQNKFIEDNFKEEK